MSLKRTNFLLVVLALCVAPAGVQAAEEAPAGPHVVKTDPAIGASGVDPGLTEIRVTFDQDMQGGMSWTGGGNVFPEVSEKPHWEADKRTCVLPVKLQAAKFYRVGINASSHRNFRGVNGVPAEFAVIYFATAGADGDTLAMLKQPKVAGLLPPNGAKEVSPLTGQLVVRFDIPMAPGFSWTKAGGQFPKTTGAAEWNGDRTSCTLPVELQPGQTYTLGLNHPYANNFQSAAGVPLPPLVWTFTTESE